MRAKEYYKKYGKRIESGDTHATVEMVNEMMDELRGLLDSRHVSTDTGLLNAINEMNEKWNVICRKFKEPTLIPNAFRDNIYKQLGITPKAVAQRIDATHTGGAANIPQ